MSQVKTKIRLLTEDDIPAIIDLTVNGPGRQEVNSFKGLDINASDCKEFVKLLLIENVSFVSTVDDKIVGVILGQIYKTWFGNNICACDHILYVHPEYRNYNFGVNLYKAFEGKCKEYNVQTIMTALSIENSNAATREKCLERWGYEPRMIYYEKRINK